MAKYESIDKIQNALASDVFKNATDKKKAAGRALGTIVELITYYWLCRHGFRNSLTIEHTLIEFGNIAISHNVEFGLHPILDSVTHDVDYIDRISSNRLIKKFPELLLKPGLKLKGSGNIIFADGLIKNAFSLKIDGASHQCFICNVNSKANGVASITTNQILKKPYAIVECKRVGVEEGARKGPTTIEKAKQGAYVAKHASKLQKIKDIDGKQWGVLPLGNGLFDIKPYREQLRSYIEHVDASEMNGIVITVGVTSNHGNWFTKGNMNKELLVLNQSYDWLLFLKDSALVEFINELVLEKASGPVRDAFIETYGVPRAERGANKLTKSKLTYEAHLELVRYFDDNWFRLNADQDGWFTVLGPESGTLTELITELNILKNKGWK